MRILRSSNKTKGLRRCLAKAQEEYEGDYTRLIDLSRTTIICSTIRGVFAVFSFLLGQLEKPLARFKPCRVKDRLTRAWDAEQSGGNRDLLINGWLNLGANKHFIVEVQVHLESLFEMKHNLHVLYVGARVLGALDDLTIRWEGRLEPASEVARLTKEVEKLEERNKQKKEELGLLLVEREQSRQLSTRNGLSGRPASSEQEDSVLDRVARGVLRKLGVAHSAIKPRQRDRIHALLHIEPCPLIFLDVSQCYLAEAQSCSSTRQLSITKEPVFKGYTLDALFTPPRSQTLLSTIDERAHPKDPRGANEGSTPETNRSLACWRLRDLRLNGVGLTGGVTDQLKDCLHLYNLRIGSNDLTGLLPDWLFNASILPNLKVLFLSFNRFQGGIPATFSDSQLSEFYARGNDLSGTLPKCPAALRILNLSENQLTGLQDGCFKGCEELEEINLDTNKIESWFSQISFEGCASLKVLHMEHNRLTGELGSVFELCAQWLKFFRVSGNQIEGHIPPSIVKCQKLKDFNADDNRLTALPPSMEGCVSLKEFTASNNRLAGRIPPLHCCPKLKLFDVSGNKLSGEMPEFPASTDKFSEWQVSPEGKFSRREL